MFGQSKVGGFKRKTKDVLEFFFFSSLAIALGYYIFLAQHESNLFFKSKKAKLLDEKYFDLSGSKMCRQSWVIDSDTITIIRTSNNLYIIK